MAQVMARQGLGLSAPQSRQDIVSALLNDYGNSFAGDGSSPSASAFSPVPADKDLPPPPPGSDSMRNKPLPAVQRAEQRMSTKFQLRTIADGPLSPVGTPRDPSSPPPRQRIRYRSLSREAKPPSLNLITSNGSTAIVPPTPAFSAQSQKFSPSSFADKDLPSPPPPPPAKSERRSTVERKPVGLKQSKSQSELARNDSLLSPESKSVKTERPATVEAVPTVKRKALPAPAAKKFLGLGQLGTGPRGGKGGPLPPAPRKKSADEQISPTEQGENVQMKEQQSRAQMDSAKPADELPPTPEEDKFAAAAPAPPRKAYAPLGLPSNPRARGAAASPNDTLSKSTTGLNVFKAQRPAPAVPTKVVETLTPEMTPPPTLKPEEPKDQSMSPVTPLPPPSGQRRPFSFEPAAVPAPTLAPKPAEQPKSAVPITTPQVTAPPAPIAEPQRPTSADLSGPSTPELSLPTLPAAIAQPPAILQPPVISQPAVNAAPAVIQRQPSPPVDIEENASTPPPFAPLTRAPIPWPTHLIPAITPAHLNCYASHKSNVWSNNAFQPMGCMVCRVNDKERKWCCTWCQLRICRRCSDELSMVPERNLGAYLEQRERVVVNPGDVLSDVDEVEEQDFS